MPARSHRRKTRSVRSAGLPSRHRDSGFAWGNPLVIGVVSARIIGALSMVWFPWWGLLVSYFFDWIDCWFLMQKVGYSRHRYHLVDKWLDWVCYAVEYVVAVRAGMFGLFTILLVWRFAGQLAFAKTRETRYFLITPNVFEIAYMWLVAGPAEHVTDGLSAVVYWEWFAVLVVGKMIQELWLHLFWPWYLKHYGFPPLLRPLGYHNVGI
jgi:hypothetical protein